MPYMYGKSIIKIAYADSDLTYQEFIPGFIDSIEKCKVIFQAFDCRQLDEKLKQNPDINLVVMDIVFPCEDGIHVAKKIRDEYPDIKLLFTSYFINEVIHFRAVNAGANGLVNKRNGRAELKKGILEVMKTENYFPHGLAARHKQVNGNGKGNGNYFSITEEEIIFLKHISTELTYEAIAATMNIPSRRAEYLRLGLFEKFQVHSRPELAIIAKNSGLSQ